MTMMIVVIFIIVIDESSRPIPMEEEIGPGLVAKNWVTHPVYNKPHLNNLCIDFQLRLSVCILCNSTGRSEIWDKNVMSTENGNFAVLVQRVEFIPNFTPTRAITMIQQYINTKVQYKTSFLVHNSRLSVRQLFNTSAPL